MLIFVDFEASSLSKHSYPIEVGWVTEDGAGEGHLIRPAPGWTEWDVSAEAIHGISRDRLLREGEPHEAVCERLIGALAGNQACASAPSWDGHWLSMLLRASNRPRHLLRLSATRDAFAAAARARLGTGDEEAVAALVESARASAGAGEAEHRAVADARREWRTWKAIRG